MKNISQAMRLRDVTNDQKLIIDSIEYDKAKENKLKIYIRKYLTNGYDLNILKENWNQIAILGNTSSSLESNIIRYGNIIGTELFHEKIKKTTMTTQDYVDRYGIKDATNRLSLRGASLENYITRHGTEAGRKRWDAYCDKRASTFAKGRADNKYASRDLNWYKGKYGDEVGYAKWDNKRKSRATKISRAYLESVHGKEQTDIILKKRHARDIQFYANKYGSEDGANRYRKAIYRSHKNRRNKSYSKWAYNCCAEIKEVINDLFYFGDNELIIGLTNQQMELFQAKVIMPDLFYRGKIIEFNGDVFHGNPMLYEDSSTPHPFNKTITAKELQKKDSLRYKYYASKDYDVLIIWENEFKNNKEQVIQKCLEFLK